MPQNFTQDTCFYTRLTNIPNVVRFESFNRPGYFIMVDGNKLKLSTTNLVDNTEFYFIGKNNLCCE